MSRIGYTYGSEWHLLRYLSYHRDEFDLAVEATIPGCSVLGWLDSTFERRPSSGDGGPPRFLDRKYENLDFLPGPDRDRLRGPLGGFWPSTGSHPSWDAVGRVKVGEHTSWLIVEAKSHLGELNSTCKAKRGDVGGGRERIVGAFRSTMESLGISGDAESWMGPFYQFCNRIAFLDFLDGQGIPAHLLLDYFLGDRFPPGRGVACPEAEAGWRAALDDMEGHVGWRDGNRLSHRVHKLFLPVSPA